MFGSGHGSQGWVEEEEEGRAPEGARGEGCGVEAAADRIAGIDNLPLNYYMVSPLPPH